MNTPEIWLTIPFEPELEASSLGKIRNPQTATILKARANRSGYLQIVFRKKCIIVHRAIAETFLGDRHGRDVNHKDGNKLNNHLDNLEYVSTGQNIQHAYDYGLRSRPLGERNPKAKLTEDAVREIKTMLQQGINQKRIAQQMGVEQTTISNIKVGKTWGHIK